MTIAFYLCLALFVVVACTMLGLILLQKGQGLNALLGGSSGHSVLGGRTPTVVTWVIAGAFAAFLGLAVVLNLLA